MRARATVRALVLFLVGALCACGGSDGEPGADGTSGTNGTDGSSCSVALVDGVKTISCTDGTQVTVADGKDGANGADGANGTDGQDGVNGQDGADGSSCSVTDNGDGTMTVACADGTTAVLSNGTDGVDGTDGQDGTNGSDGADGADGTSCSVTGNPDGSKTLACTDGTSVTILNGVDGADGVDGTNGTNGTNGQDGSSCGVSDNGDGTKTIACADGTTVVVKDGQDGADGTDGTNGTNGVDGHDGHDGAGYLPKAAAGVVGFVRDTAGDAVAGATVYLVPGSDIPTAALDLSSIAAARASTVDEPLEDTIAANGAAYQRAETDSTGAYRIEAVAEGRYYVAVIPAVGDTGHLPGGDQCRQSLLSSELVGTQLDLTLSTRPSDAAEFVGASVCYSCHGQVHEKETLHMLGIQVAGKPGPMQKTNRFPEWNKPFTDKFTVAGTTLYFYAYDAAKVSWKVSETDPGAGVSFTARLYGDGAGSYGVELSDVAGTSPSVTYPVELTYGGGIYKQRYVTKIGGSRYVLPIQYNTEGITSESGVPSGRWVWQHYNAQNWYDETNKKLKVPALAKAFDNNCAGCHFTGVQVTGDATNGFVASGVIDEKGEYDYDDDGQPELMNITCESCHGPGSEHWEMAGQGRAIVAPQLLTPEREVTICAACHTRANGVGGGVTEAPLDANGRMPRAGISRAEFLASFVSKLDDGLWSATTGDGLHSVKHHQQVSDFIKSGKYRNPYDLITCASCHDLHGKSGLSHQVRDQLDTANGGEGLCLACHGPFFPQGETTGKRMQAHYASQGIADVSMGNISCVQCHMPKTAKSGSGTAQLTIDGVTYYHGDISSHLFDAPLRAGIATKGAEMMPIAYTNKCGGCHTTAP